MEPKPTCLRHLSLILYIFFCLAPAVLAAPARKGLLNLRQPDGTIVQAYLTGDENGHLVLTPDGCSLTQDAEGWWCYARYDFYGHRLNTGEHAGAPDTPLAKSSPPAATFPTTCFAGGGRPVSAGPPRSTDGNWPAPGPGKAAASATGSSSWPSSRASSSPIPGRTSRN